jgi:uncharacterized protein DUF3568
MIKLLRGAVLCIAISSLLGCVAAATTAAGIGGTAAVNHSVSGVASRTFTAPVSRVKKATFTALQRMKIDIVSEGQVEEDIYLISAKTLKREIQVEIEPISKNATRISVKARKSVFSYDAATADEIVMQTKRVLG